MKIQLISDIHLEFHKPQILGFGPELRITNAGADVLVLAGDICPARDFESSLSFFENCSKEFPHVIYIMGNHEHYKHVFNDTAKTIQDAIGKFSNIHFLDNGIFQLDGIKFIGATMWTDMNRNCPVTKHALMTGMNDFRIIKYRDRLDRYFKFGTGQAYEEHVKSRRFIEEQIKEDPKTPCIVITHHAPSYKSIHPKYEDDTCMNGGYASDLSSLMLDNDNLKLWCHGHTHTSFDYTIGSTRVVCNPLGYPGERRDPNKRFIIEICEVETH